MADVNNFKQVNTKFGHLTGDTVLAEFALLLKASIRGSDAVVRYGGDEFLILLADTTTVGSEKVIDRINQHLAEWNMGGHLDGFQLIPSIGVAEWHDGESLDEVLKVADQRMYRHKILQCSPSAIHIKDDMELETSEAGLKGPSESDSA
jgi:diguanylate cyclase (GGDEF)-like protein